MAIVASNTFSFRYAISLRIITEATIGTIFPDHGAESAVGIWIPLQQWQAGTTAELVIFGLITYEDRFGGIHHTPICERYHPPTRVNGKEIVPAGFDGNGSCAIDPTLPQIY